MIVFSFIIPHKNCPNLLQACLDSIPQREDVEIIVVDDNSTEDNIPRIERRDTTLICLTEQESRGAGHARNVGVSKSQGKWLLFADADDYYTNSFLDALLPYSSCDYDVIYFNSYFVNFEGSNEYRPNSHWDHAVEQFFSSAQSTKDRIRLTTSVNYPWNKMISRSLIDRYSLSFEEIPICNDALFSVKAGILAEKIAIIEKRLYCYVKNESGITYTKRPLSHYFLEVDSMNRINRIKRSYGLLSSISLPGFNLDVVKRDYGTLAAAKVYTYKILHDSTFVPVFLYHVYRKINSFFLLATKNKSKT